MTTPPPPPPSGPLTGRVARSFFALASGELMSRLVAMGALMYLTRVLGPAKMGTLGLATAVCTYLALAVHSGFGDVGTRAVARKPADVARITASGTMVRVLIALPAFCLIVVVAQALEDTGPILVLTGLSFFSLALDPSWALKGVERNRPVGQALVLKQSIYVLLVLTLVGGPEEFSRVPICLFAADLVISIWLQIIIMKGKDEALAFDEGLTILRESAPVMVSKISRHLIMTFDVVLLGVLLKGEAADRELGLYTVPYSIAFMVMSLSVVLHDSYRPAFVRAMERGKKDLHQVCRRAFASAAAVGAPVTVGGILVAGHMIGLIMGEEFLPGTAPFRLILASVGLLFLNGVLHNVFIAADRLRQETVVQVSAATVNIGLNLVLIPSYGLMGAASATLAAEAFSLCCGFFILWRRGLLAGVRSILRPLIAAGIMGAAVYLVGHDQSLLVTIPVGVVTYSLALILLRGVPEDAGIALGRRTESDPS